MDVETIYVETQFKIENLRNPMQTTHRKLQEKKSIVLIAHDHYKTRLLHWVETHRSELAKHTLYATGTTGNLIENNTGLPINKLISGPLGGDQQAGALIAEGKIDVMIFFWDPLSAAAHDPDVKALLRIATVWNIPIATNQVTADFILHSPLINQTVDIEIPDYANYLQERIS